EVTEVTEGVDFNETVAVFSDTSETADAFAAVINWGDGELGEGSIEEMGDDTFAVVASHTYAQAGLYDIQVTLLDDGNEEAVINSTAFVEDTPIELQEAEEVSAAVEGQEFTQTLATLVGENMMSDGTEFRIDIDWGDGEIGQGTVESLGDGNFAVIGVHA